MTTPTLTDEQRHQIVCISESYQRLTGKHLVAGTGDPFQMLWSAPCAIVAHGTEPDPIFFFGNRVALELFELDFNTFTRLPSRLSAEAALRDERARLFQRLTEDDIVEDYAGVRISSTGKRFKILNASVWNLTDSKGGPVGQAAAFSDWVSVTPSNNNS